MSTIKGTWKTGNPPKEGTYRLWCQKGGNFNDPASNPWYSYWTGSDWGPTGGPKFAEECKGKSNDQFPRMQWKWLDESADTNWMSRGPTQPTKPGVYKVRCQVHREGKVEPWMAYWDGLKWGGASGASPEAAMKYYHQGDTLESRADEWLNEAPIYVPNQIKPEPKAKYIAGQMYTFIFPGDKKTYFVQFCEDNQFALCEESYDAAKRNKKGVVTISGAESSWGTIVPAKSAVEIMVPGFYDVSFKDRKRVVVYTIGNGKCTGYSSTIEGARRFKHQNDNYKLPGDLFSDPKLLLAEMLDIKEPEPIKNQKEPTPTPAPTQIKAAEPPRRRAPARRRILLLS